MLRLTFDRCTHPVRRASFLFSRLMLCALGLTACGARGGDGTVRIDGQAPLYGDDCEQLADDAYLLGYHPGGEGMLSTIDRHLALIQQAGGSVLAKYAPQIPMAAARIPPELVLQLRQDPDLAYLSRNCRYKPQSVGLAAVPWALDRIDQRQGLDYVYQMSGTGRGVEIYVIDTGIKVDHPEFGGRAQPLYSAIEDGHGASDCEGHGTEVAGIIGGLDHGVAKEATLYSVRVADCVGIASDMTIAGGVQHAIDHHTASQKPAVINLSMAQGTVTQAASQALDAASAAGILVIAAAGNFGLDACSHFPAARPGAVHPELDPEPIVVGVTDEHDQAVLSGVSHGAQIPFDYGPCITLYAPGSRVQTISNLDDTAEILDSGTSLAAASVTGVAAIYMEKYANATPQQIKAAIIHQATSGVVSGAPPQVINPLLIYSMPQINGVTVPARAIQLAAPYPPRPASQQHEVFEDTSFLYSAIPNGYHAILAADLDGTAPTAVDDVMELDCVDVDAMGAPFGSLRLLTLDYSHGCMLGHRTALPPYDLSSSLVRNQAGRCRFQLRNQCAGTVGTSRLIVSFLH